MSKVKLWYHPIDCLSTRYQNTVLLVLTCFEKFPFWRFLTRGCLTGITSTDCRISPICVCFDSTVTVQYLHYLHNSRSLFSLVPFILLNIPLCSLSVSSVYCCAVSVPLCKTKLFPSRLMPGVLGGRGPFGGTLLHPDRQRELTFFSFLLSFLHCFLVTLPPRSTAERLSSP